MTEEGTEPGRGRILLEGCFLPGVQYTVLPGPGVTRGVAEHTGTLGRAEVPWCSVSSSLPHQEWPEDPKTCSRPWVSPQEHPRAAEVFSWRVFLDQEIPVQRAPHEASNVPFLSHKHTLCVAFSLNSLLPPLSPPSLQPHTLICPPLPSPLPSFWLINSPPGAFCQGVE